jgi:hypothetical protein
MCIDREGLIPAINPSYGPRRLLIPPHPLIPLRPIDTLWASPLPKEDK